MKFDFLVEWINNITEFIKLKFEDFDAYYENQDSINMRRGNWEYINNLHSQEFQENVMLTGSMLNETTGNQ